MKIASLFLMTCLAAAATYGSASAQTTQSLSGKIVSYLSSAGANGSAISLEPGTGGISVSNRVSIHAHGASQLVQPLGLLANGQLYLLSVPNDHQNLVSKLAKDQGHNVDVKGHAETHDGASVFVVDSVS